MFEYRFSNTFYAQRAESGIKYTYNHGIPNVDNPKLAARHFLNAIGRAENLKEKYQKTLHGLEQNIPMVMQIANRPFEREAELQQMKSGLARLEREIALKIQENQMKQNGAMDSGNHDGKEQGHKAITETPIIQMHTKENAPMQVVLAKANGMAVNGKKNCSASHSQ